MAFDTQLADRIHHLLSLKKVPFEEKEMMGGIAFMVNEKMCVGVNKDELMGRIDPAMSDMAFSKTGCRPMDFTGRPMKGWITVDPSGTESDKQLDYWVQLCLDFNPKAKKSAKRKKK